VVVSGPEAASTLLRAEGKYPSRGYFEENMMWIYRNINKPYPMFFRYVPQNNFFAQSLIIIISVQSELINL
jgi:hypothetical protein